MKRSIFTIFIIFGFLGLSDYANAICDYVPNPLITESGSWTVDESCFDTDSEAISYCESIPHYRFESTTYEGKQGYYVYVNPVGSFHLSYCWVDPDNVEDDSDGDGMPDDQDPCPTNPDPNCKDPNDPPDPPDIPDDIEVGDCTFDLRSFKEWLNTDSSFPFNLMFRLVVLITPLFDLTPEPPVFDISIDASSISGRFSYIPSNISFSWDFTQYDIYAKILRSVEILSIVIAVISYGLNSNKERP